MTSKIHYINGTVPYKLLSLRTQFRNNTISQKYMCRNPTISFYQTLTTTLIVSLIVKITDMMSSQRNRGSRWRGLLKLIWHVGEIVSYYVTIQTSVHCISFLMG